MPIVFDQTTSREQRSRTSHSITANPSPVAYNADAAYRYLAKYSPTPSFSLCVSRAKAANVASPAGIHTEFSYNPSYAIVDPPPKCGVVMRPPPAKGAEPLDLKSRLSPNFSALDPHQRVIDFGRSATRAQAAQSGHIGTHGVAAAEYHLPLAPKYHVVTRNPHGLVAFGRPRPTAAKDSKSASNTAALAGVPDPDADANSDRDDRSLDADDAGPLKKGPMHTHDGMKAYGVLSHVSRVQGGSWPKPKPLARSKGRT